MAHTSSKSRRLEAEDSITINADFVRHHAKMALVQFFRPITATFEQTPLNSAQSEVRITTVHIPKAERVQMRGYSLKRK